MSLINCAAWQDGLEEVAGTCGLPSGVGPHSLGSKLVGEEQCNIGHLS